MRIPLPGKLDQAGKLARQLGQGAKVDAFELSMNRAAEKAVPQVAQIFGDAIRKMSLSDARAILTGGNHAATDYFRRVAGDALTARIHPIVAKATDSVGVTQKYKSFTAGSGGVRWAVRWVRWDRSVASRRAAAAVRWTWTTTSPRRRWTGCSPRSARRSSRSARIRPRAAPTC